MKAYKDLTTAGKAKRLAKYDAERAELSKKYGVDVQDVLANLVRPATIKENSNGSKTAIMRLAIYNAEEKKTDFVTGTMYIAEGKESLEGFITGLDKGDLLSIRYVVNDHGNMNLWSVFKRERPQKEEA